MNLQTLFGKDYFVILRPSLCFNLENNNKTVIVICSVVLCLLILLFVIFVLWKYMKMKKEGKKINFKNFREELLFGYKLEK